MWINVKYLDSRLCDGDTVKGCFGLKWNQQVIFSSSNSNGFEKTLLLIGACLVALSVYKSATSDNQSQTTNFLNRPH